MQIITLDHIDFPALLDNLNSAHKIGFYTRGGRAHSVFAGKQFVFVTALGLEGKIAIKPSRNLHEATEFAKEILKKEAARGAAVEVL